MLHFVKRLVPEPALDVARLLAGRPQSPQDTYLRQQRRAGTFSFVHINKCGGTSVERALGLPKIHDTALERRDRIGADRWAQMFTFAVVRHPYDKVCSHYRYRIKTNQTGLGAAPIPLNDWVLRAYGEKDPAYYDQPLMFAPCIHWITDARGKIIVDHIAKLEEIDQDWPSIAARIGVAAALPKANATKPAGASRELLSEEVRALIDTLFDEDFTEFGYSKG